jgi:hypothetical protein
MKEQWWSHREGSTLDCLQAWAGLLEKHEPRQGLRVLLPHLAPPQFAQAATQSPPDILGRVSKQKRRPGWLFARPPCSLHSSLAFAFSVDAQPRDCASFLLAVPSKALSQGPDTPQARRAPAPPTRGALPPARSTLRDPKDLRARRWRPREATWGAAAPPAGCWSCTPERAMSPTPEVLNFTLDGCPSRVCGARFGCRGPGNANSRGVRGSPAILFSSPSRCPLFPSSDLSY